MMMSFESKALNTPLAKATIALDTGPLSLHHLSVPCTPLLSISPPSRLTSSPVQINTPQLSAHGCWGVHHPFTCHKAPHHASASHCFFCHPFLFIPAFSPKAAAPAIFLCTFLPQPKPQTSPCFPLIHYNYGDMDSSGKI